MRVAEVIAQRGTCSRATVGAVISIEGRILGTGYNGVAAGMEHCAHDARPCGITLGFRVSGVGPSAVESRIVCSLAYGHKGKCSGDEVSGCDQAIHAEQNAVSFAARWGVSTQGATMHCTYSPCYACAKTVVQAGIVEFVYLHRYRADAQSLALFKRLGVKYGQLVYSTVKEFENPPEFGSAREIGAV